MKRLGLTIALLLLLVRAAFAACAGCTTLFAENWENYATTTYTSGTPSIGPWTANVCGNVSCGTVGVVCTTGLPWKTAGVTGCYLHQTPGAVTIPNNGTGTYLPFGTPRQKIMITFPFRYTGTLTNAVASNFFFRWNKNNATPIGTDFQANPLDGTGHIGTYGGTTSNAFSKNTWQVYSECAEWGAGSANGKDYITVDGVSWLSATGLSAFSGGTATNDIALDNEYTNVTGMDFGPVIISDPGSCSSSTFYSQFKAWNVVPVSNGTVAWTPSAGANWSNVLSGSGNSNSSNTNGQQDLYNLASGALGTIIAQGVLAQFQNDAVGDRIPLPVWTVGGVTTVGTVTNTLPPVGSYAATMVPIAGSVVPTQIGVKVNN